jgi:putative endonuclease
VNTREIGKEAERYAVKYLKSRGYKILCTNWTCYAGEIDIVAYKERLIFVEVKSAFSRLCSPCEQFNSRKRRILLRTINNFLSKNFAPESQIPEYQIDLICISGNSNINKKIFISHYRDVFDDI